MYVLLVGNNIVLLCIYIPRYLPTLSRVRVCYLHKHHSTVWYNMYIRYFISSKLQAVFTSESRPEGSSIPCMHATEQLNNFLRFHFRNHAPNSTMPSDPASKELSYSLVLLFRLIEANDWNKLDSIFLTNPEGQVKFRRLAALIANSKAFNGMTILHVCAKFNPPPKVVSRIIELCPDTPRAQDRLKRTPLHVMAGTDTPSYVIKVLANAYPDACTIQDSDGRTPLHFACDSSCELFEDDIRKSVQSAPSITTIGVLLAASPESVVLKDKKGMSAIECALCSGAELRTFKLLQKATQRVMSRNREGMKNNSAKDELVCAMKSAKEKMVESAAPRKVMPVEFPRKCSINARSA